MIDYHDQSFEELEPKLSNILMTGGVFWGKFTCGNCGSRQTFEEPNKLFTSGICEECGKTTELNKWGYVTLLTKSQFLEGDHYA